MGYCDRISVRGSRLSTSHSLKVLLFFAAFSLLACPSFGAIIYVSSGTSPSTINADETTNITVSYDNTGSSYPNGYISLSFPNWDVVSWSGDLGSGKLYRAGDSIYDKNGAAIKASYPLVEFSGSWSSNTRKTVSVVARPKAGASGTLSIYFRAALCNSDFSSCQRDPSSGTTDQQGWPVRERTVNVFGPSTYSIMAITNVDSVLVSTSGKSCTTGWDGVRYACTIQSLPAGTYAVTATKTGYKSSTVSATVPPEQTITFSLSKLDGCDYSNPPCDSGWVCINNKCEPDAQAPTVSGIKDSYTVGETVQFTAVGSIGGPHLQYSSCEAVIYKHAEAAGSLDSDGNTAERIPLGSRSRGSTVQVGASFSVTQSMLMGVGDSTLQSRAGEFRVRYHCDGGTGGSSSYTYWDGPWAAKSWTAMPVPSCVPSEPAIGIDKIYGDVNGVKFSVTVTNNRCSDISPAYTVSIDGYDVKSVLIASPIAPKASYTDNHNLLYALSIGPHTIKACLDSGSGGSCAAKTFQVSSPQQSLGEGVEIPNHDFEADSVISGCSERIDPRNWTVLSGTGNSPGISVGVGIDGVDFVCKGENFQGANYAYLGGNNGMGAMRSADFILPEGAYRLRYLRAGGGGGGSGVFLKDASDDSTICSVTSLRATDVFFEEYCTGLSQYVGKTVYIYVVDSIATGWGKVFVDDFHIQDANGNNLLVKLPAMPSQSLDISGWEFDPRNPTLGPGDSFTIRYRIMNPHDNLYPVVLDGELISEDGLVRYSDPANALTVWALPGEAWYWREFKIPDDVARGSYSALLSIYDQASGRILDYEHTAPSISLEYYNCSITCIEASESEPECETDCEYGEAVSTDYPPGSIFLSSTGFLTFKLLSADRKVLEEYGITFLQTHMGEVCIPENLFGVPSGSRVIPHANIIRNVAGRKPFDAHVFNYGGRFFSVTDNVIKEIIPTKLTPSVAEVLSAYTPEELILSKSSYVKLLSIIGSRLSIFASKRGAASLVGTLFLPLRFLLSKAGTLVLMLVDEAEEVGSPCIDTEFYAYHHPAECRVADFPGNSELSCLPRTYVRDGKYALNSNSILIASNGALIQVRSDHILITSPDGTKSLPVYGSYEQNFNSIFVDDKDFGVVLESHWSMPVGDGDGNSCTVTDVHVSSYLPGGNLELQRIIDALNSVNAAKLFSPPTWFR